MSHVPKELIYTDLLGDAVPLPQFTRQSDGKQMEAKGEAAPFVQMVDPDGYPVSVNKPLPVVQKGSIAMESWEGSTNTRKTFPDERHGFSIVNDGDSDISFTINGNTRIVRQDEFYSALFEPFLVVDINTTSAYRAEVLK